MSSKYNILRSSKFDKEEKDKKDIIEVKEDIKKEPQKEIDINEEKRILVKEFINKIKNKELKKKEIIEELTDIIQKYYIDLNENLDF
jgi:hypothetical protein